MEELQYYLQSCIEVSDEFCLELRIKICCGQSKIEQMHRKCRNFRQNNTIVEAVQLLVNLESLWYWCPKILTGWWRNPNKCWVKKIGQECYMRCWIKQLTYKLSQQVMKSWCNEPHTEQKTHYNEIWKTQPNRCCDYQLFSSFQFYFGRNI